MSNNIFIRYNNMKIIEFISASRYIEQQGIALYELAEQQDLEGIVAKRKNSIYIQDRRTREWIKIKNLKDEDYVVCGYIPRVNNVVSLVLGQYNGEGKLKYKGHVTLEVSRKEFAQIQKVRRRKTSPIIDVPRGNENAIWLTPSLVYTVKYMQKHESGLLRQPVLKA